MMGGGLFLMLALVVLIIDGLRVDPVRDVLKGDPDRKDVLFGRREPEFSGDEEVYIDNNDAQNAAVTLATRADDLALVHGPPGTGKTYTIARTVRATGSTLGAARHRR